MKPTLLYAKSKEELNTILKHLHNNGFQWANGDSLLREREHTFLTNFFSSCGHVYLHLESKYVLYNIRKGVLYITTEEVKEFGENIFSVKEYLFMNSNNSGNKGPLFLKERLK